MGDLAFGGIQHFLTQVKLSKKKTSLDADEDLFDMDFRRVRNRIEQFFARIDKHRFIWYNTHGEEWNRQAFGLVFNAECVSCEDDDTRLTNDRTSPLYPTVKFEALGSDHVQKWDEASECDCDFPKIEPKGEQSKSIKAYRSELITYIRAQYGNTYVMRKPSKHSKSGAVSRPAHTRTELKELFGARRAARTAERKQIKKDALQKKKAAKAAKKRAEEEGVEEGGDEAPKNPKKAKKSEAKKSQHEPVPPIEAPNAPVRPQTPAHHKLMIFDEEDE